MTILPTNFAPHPGQTVELPLLDGLAVVVGEYLMRPLTGDDAGKCLSADNLEEHEFAGFVEVEAVGPGSDLKVTVTQAGTYWMTFAHDLVVTDSGVAYIADNNTLALEAYFDPDPAYVPVGILRQTHATNRRLGLVTLIPGLKQLL